MERLLKSRFRIGDKISENPFSITYQGTFLAADRPLIIKIYKRGALNSSLIRDMKQKVKDFMELNYHGIAKIIDGDYGWQGFYYVREHIQGQSLKDLLDKGEKFGIEKATAIIIEACKALEICHKKGMIHGALKPSNIFIDKKGVVRIADFVIEGAIKESWPQKAAEMLENGFYASPEEILGLPATALSDIYTLAMVLYELVNDAKLADSRQVFSKEGKLKASVPVDAKSLAILPRYLQEILIKALQKDPALRFGSMQEFKDSLENKSLVQKANPASEYVKIFEQTVTRFGEEDIPIGSDCLQDVGQLNICWNKEKHRNWILIAVLAFAVVAGLSYAFLLGGR